MLTDLLFPPVCLSCDALREPGFNLFCRSCFSLLELAEPDDDGRFPSLSAWSPVFEKRGPALDLLREIGERGRAAWAQGAAAFMAMQLLRLDWPKPDLILAEPLSWLQRLSRGCDPAPLLASFLSPMLSCPWSRLGRGRPAEPSLEGLSLLLVGLEESEAFEGHAERLWEQAPKEIRALFFC